MMALLESKSVEGLIDGTKTEPGETADETTKATWKRNNALAKSLISKPLMKIILRLSQHALQREICEFV